MIDIYKSGELEEEQTCTKTVQVATEGDREVSRTVRIYNLDAIISVGYRVNSRKATDFRIWATGVLKRHIVNGVAVNERRLGELSQKKLQEVNETLDVVRRLMAQSELTGDEANGILEIIAQYAETFRTLQEYDEGYVRLGKAANLLYFVIKDHPFFDGNKRIAALLFIGFLAQNRYGLLKNGEAKISDRALVALTLMIAESEPREKGLMVAVVCRLLEE